MSHHLLAAVMGATVPTYFLVRLVLPAGTSTDELAQDLRINFADPQKALALCKHGQAIRGLPSKGEMFTPEEQPFLPSVPETVETLEKVVETADEIEATSTTIFDGIQWLRLRGDGEKEPLNDIELFRLIPGA